MIQVSVVDNTIELLVVQEFSGGDVNIVDILYCKH